MCESCWRDADGATNATLVQLILTAARDTLGDAAYSVALNYGTVWIAELLSEDEGGDWTSHVSADAPELASALGLLLEQLMCGGWESHVSADEETLSCDCGRFECRVCCP